MFRLDYIDGTGKSPVLGVHIGILPTGTVLTRHMTTARKHATTAAARARQDVLITRIGKAGALRPSLIVQADGGSRRPPGTRPANERDECKRENGETCFCPSCRAERRQARRTRA